MNRVILAVSFALVVAACGAETDSLVDAGEAQGGGRGGNTSADAAARGGRDAGATADAARTDAKPRGPQVCEPGEQAACMCERAGQMSLPGTKICLESSGVYSQCGCAFEHPYLGPTCQGGKVQCLPTINEDTQYAARHCCTDAGRCGLSNPDVTGGRCVERGVEPAGKLTGQCGQTIVPFIETQDCCRPDNRCGLWLRQGDNWEDLGCVERTGMAALLKNSGTLGFFLFLIGRSSALDDIKSAPCNYQSAD